MKRKRVNTKKPKTAAAKNTMKVANKKAQRVAIHK